MGKHAWQRGEHVKVLRLVGAAWLSVFGDACTAQVGLMQIVGTSAGRAGYGGDAYIWVWVWVWVWVGFGFGFGAWVWVWDLWFGTGRRRACRVRGSPLSTQGCGV